jgi:uncharacterized membrane protein YuzA (DUF378 family)
MKGLHKLTWILVIIGGLNWLLVGLFNWGVGSVLPVGIAKIVYILVGLSALVELFSHKKNCAECSAPKASTPNTNM